MPTDQLTAQLTKAAGNLKKLNEFFAARASWPVAADAAAPAREFAEAAAAVDTHLKDLVERCGDDPMPPADPQVEALPPRELDADRLGRFAAFLRDLDRWFSAQPGVPTDDEGMAALREMEASLASTVRLAVAIAGHAPRADSDPPGPSSVEVPQRPAPRTAGANPGSGGAAEVVQDPPVRSRSVDAGGPMQLALDDTEAEPLTQVFRDVAELTPLCEQKVDEFLAAWDIEYSHISRKKFLERLLKWILGAPEGQVLVLKMSTAGEKPEPFPAYVARDVLRSRTPAQ